MTVERLTDDHVRYAVEIGLPGSVVLADVPLPDDLVLPDHLISEAREAAASDWPSDVISDHRRVPHRAEDWVACVEAKPHRDPFFRDHLFLTVTIDDLRQAELALVVARHEWFRSYLLLQLLDPASARSAAR